MVQTADGTDLQKKEGASRNGDDKSNPMWAHIMRLLDDEEQAAMVFQIFKQASDFGCGHRGPSQRPALISVGA